MANKVWVLEAAGGEFNRIHHTEPRVHILGEKKSPLGDRITLCGKTPFGNAYALYTTKLDTALDLKKVLSPVEQAAINFRASFLITCRACRRSARKIITDKEYQTYRAHLKKKRERLANKGSRRTKQLRQARKLKEDTIGLGY